MSVKVPIRTVFDGSTATGLAEFQSGEFIGLTHGGIGASLSIGSAGQVLKVNSGGTALEFGDNLNFASPTITGTAVMTNLDISGDVDVDGTLEADAITINGATLTETITDLVGGMVSSNTETGITVTFQDADNTLDFALGSAQTTITSLLATDIKIGEDDQTKIDFETADEIHFYAANAEQVYVADGIFGPQTDSDVDLGTTGVRWKNAFIDSITTTGDVTVGGDLTISGDDLTMATNTAGHILVADGTNFNPVAVTDLSEISTIANGDTFLAVDASGGGLKKVTRSTVVSGLATSSAISNLSEDDTPQLGGNLDMNGSDIVTTSNATIDLAPNGTGTVVVRGNTNSGRIVFNCESNSHGQTVASQPHSATVTNTMLLPAGASSTLVSLVSTDTLTNKTLTSPVINTGTFGTSILPTSADGTTLGSASKEFSDLFLADGGTIKLGNDQDVTLTHVADTGILLNSTNVIQFNDASQNIGAPNATTLDINATAEIELNATLVDINANLDVSGTIVSAGVITGTGFTAGNAVITEAELELLDGLTAGTAIASKVVTTDANIDSTGMRNLTISGELDAATLDISGAIDVAGNSVLASVDVTGLATAATFEPDGDTAAGDNAAIGYTAAEGLILTGQGSTNDVTIKNDADADVIEIPTGTTNVTIAGTLGTGGVITSGAGLLIADAGTIGSASDTDALAISSGGVVTFSQKPVFSSGGAGKVLQVVQGLGNAEFDTTSSSFVKCTNLNATITPSASSSKILIQIMGLVKTEQYTRYMMMSIFRNINGGGEVEISDTGTATDNTANGFLRIYDGGTSITEQHATVIFVDSPDTTSQIVYSPAIRHGQGNTPGAHFGVANAKCVMILTEIAG